MSQMKGCIMTVVLCLSRGLKWDHPPVGGYDLGFSRTRTYYIWQVYEYIVYLNACTGDDLGPLLPRWRLRTSYIVDAGNKCPQRTTTVEFPAIIWRQLGF